MIGFHHLRSRALATKGLEPFPASSTSRKFLDYLMYAVGVLAPFALLPQIIQIFTTKSGAGLSLPTWLLFIIFNALWTLYGAVHKDKHIFFANLLMALFNAVVVLEILMYPDVL